MCGLRHDRRPARRTSCHRLCLCRRGAVPSARCTSADADAAQSPRGPLLPPAADSDRQDIVTRFQDRESPLRFFVGNPRTGGYGLTLTASNTVVYYSNSYDLEIRLQSEDRAHRISQTKKVTYIDLISEGTVDEFIVKNLRGKINLATKVLGEEFKKWLI